MALAVPMPRHTGERGASAVEYALLMLLIAVAIIGGVTLFGGAVDDMFTTTCSAVSGGAC